MVTDSGPAILDESHPLLDSRRGVFAEIVVEDLGHRLLLLGFEELGRGNGRGDKTPEIAQGIKSYQTERPASIQSTTRESCRIPRGWTSSP